jgi:hypothetical protein
MNKKQVEEIITSWGINPIHILPVRAIVENYGSDGALALAQYDIERMRAPALAQAKSAKKRDI